MTFSAAFLILVVVKAEIGSTPAMTRAGVGLLFAGHAATCVSLVEERRMDASMNASTSRKR